MLCKFESQLKILRHENITYVSTENWQINKSFLSPLTAHFLNYFGTCSVFIIRYILLFISAIKISGYRKFENKWIVNAYFLLLQS